MEIPNGAGLVEISPWYNEKTVPRELQAPSSLPAETWGRVVVESGMLELAMRGESPVQAKPDQPVVIPPGTLFQVLKPVAAVRFHIHYFHTPRVTNADNLAAMISRS